MSAAPAVPVCCAKNPVPTSGCTWQVGQRLLAGGAPCNLSWYCGERCGEEGGFFRCWHSADWSIFSKKSSPSAVMCMPSAAEPPPCCPLCEDSVIV